MRTTPCSAGQRHRHNILVPEQSERPRGGAMACRYSGHAPTAWEWRCRVRSSVDCPRLAVRGAGDVVELAAEIIPRLLPVHRRHDLAGALLARGWRGKAGMEARTAARDLSLARLLQKNTNAGRVLHRGAAE